MEPNQESSASPESSHPLTDDIRRLLARQIEHDKYRNTVIFKSSSLIRLLKTEGYCVPVDMSELHRKAFNKLIEAMRVVDSRDASRSVEWQLSRTNHGQLAALCAKYDESSVMTAACVEAGHLETIAAELVQAVTEERGKGNVHFIRAKAGKVL